MFRKMCSVIVTFVFALGHVAQADAPTVGIQQQATLDPANFGVLVTVAVNCGDPAPTEFQLEVAVRQGDIAGTSGGVFFPATGGRQVVSIDVFGPFTAGDANASALLVCGPLFEGQELGATIKISE
jgi:hypothetical protein